MTLRRINTQLRAGCFWTVWLLALIVATAQPENARASETSSAVLLVDSSARMAGKIGGPTALVAVGDALASNFVSYDSKLNLGLVTFGGAGKGCSAATKAMPIRPLKAATYAQRIAGLKPSGKASLSFALNSAVAMSMKSSIAPTLVLLSGGGDQCGGNPCNLVAALEKQEPNLTVHVIAIGKGGRNAAKTLKCVADKTGGQFQTAGNSAEIAAAVATAFQAVAAGPPAPEAAQVVTTTEAGQETNSEVTTSAGWTSEATIEDDAGGQTIVIERTAPGPDGTAKAALDQTPLHLTASLVENGRAIPTGLVWRVYAAKRSRGGKYKLLKTVKKPAPVVQLSPGEYLVNAAYGRAHLTKRITIEPDTPSEERFVLNAGGLRFQAVWPNGQKLPDQSVTYDILSDERDQFGKRQPIMTGARGGLIIRLNAGLYHISSSYGDANAVAEADVTVEAGKLTDITVNHGGARVTFKLVLQPGGEALAGTRWRIADANGQLVKESAGALPTHILAAGRYTVMALRGTQKFAREFQIKPGEARQIEVVAR